MAFTSIFLVTVTAFNRSLRVLLFLSWRGEAKLLDNRQFLGMNCRVPVVTDSVRPQSRQGQNADEDNSCQRT
eukprot:1065589-Amphidinium_carterae.1